MSYEIDNGYDHESKIKEKALSCPPLSGFNHPAVFLRWAYNRGFLSDKLLNGEPLLEPALKGKGDVREVMAKSNFMKGAIRPSYFKDDCKLFVCIFYQFSGENIYPGCVDKNAEVYFGTEKYNSEEFKDEAYLFVPYDYEYYKNLSAYIDEAWEKCPDIMKGPTIGKEKLDYICDMIKQLTEKDAIFFSVHKGKTSLTSSKIGGYPYWPSGKEYPVDSNGDKLVLLAQVNLSDFKFDKLPDTGLLQFFISTGDKLGLDDEEGSKVVYHKTIDENIKEEDVKNLGIPSNEEFADGNREFRSAKDGIAGNDEVSLPTYESYPITFTVQKDSLHAGQAGYVKIVDEIMRYKYGCYVRRRHFWQIMSDADGDYLYYQRPDVEHKMFGHPFFIKEDPRKTGPVWRVPDLYNTLLFQLDSESGNEEGVKIMIGNKGIINFFIDDDDLKNLDFDDVLYHWDNH